MMTALAIFAAFLLGYFTRGAMEHARRADDQSETLCRQISWPSPLD